MTIICRSTFAAALCLFAMAQLSADEKVAGIAAAYPGDKNIDRHPSVVFCENFEHEGLETLPRRWETVRDADVMSFSSEVPRASSGRRSLLMSQVAEKGTGGDLYRRLGNGHERIHARMYVRFADDCEPIHHFGTCIGGNNPSTAWPSVKAGQPTIGDKSFWVGIEPFGDQWQWDYIGAKCEEARRAVKRGETLSSTIDHSSFAAMNGFALKS